MRSSLSELTLAFLAASALVLAGAPSNLTVYWVSSPVHPNETAVMVHSECPGGALQRPSVELCATPLQAMSDGCAASQLLRPPVVARDANSVVFTVPSVLPLHVFPVRLVCGDSRSSWSALNQPDPMWHQCDSGRNVSTGGLIRLAGRSLAFDTACLSGSERRVTTSSIRLVPTMVGPPHVLEDSNGSCYDLTARVPATVPDGEYNVEVKNGLPGSAWTAVEHETVHVGAAFDFPSQVFRPEAFFGSVGAALAAAGEAGGGSVVLTAGKTYHMRSNETLFVPHATHFRTDGSPRATLHWVSESPRRPGSKGICGEHEWQDCSMYMVDNQPTSGCLPLVSGNGTFAVSGLHLRAPATTYLLEVQAPSHGAVVRNNLLEVVGREDCGKGKAVNIAAALHVREATGFRVTGNEIRHADVGRPQQPIAQYGGHSNITMPCGQNSPYAFSMHAGARDGLVADNLIVAGCNSWNSLSTMRIWIENNSIIAVGEYGGIEGGGITPENDRPYAMQHAVLRNHFRGTNAATGPHTVQHSAVPELWPDHKVNWGPKENPTVPLESLTSDGSRGGYFGLVHGSRERMDGSTVIALPPGATTEPNKGVAAGWVGAAVVVLNGTGRGQIRTVLSACNASSTIDVDQPFSEPLDDSSLITLVPYVGQWLVVGNHFANGTTVQVFGIGLRVVMADNELHNMTCSGQVKPAGMATTSTPYGTGIMPNTFIEIRNNYESYSEGIHVQATLFNSSLDLTYGFVMRNNTLWNPPPHVYLDNSGPGPTLGKNPGQLTVCSGARAGVVEGNTVEKLLDANYSQGYSDINIENGLAAVAVRGNAVV